MSKATGVLLAFIALFVVSSAVLTGTPSRVFADGTVQWTGQGTTGGQLNTVQCSGDTATPGSILWVFTASGASSATITINGQTFAMTQSGGGTFKYVSGWYNLSTVVASATYVGTVSGNPQLVISHGCPPGVRVSKTATTSYTSTCTWTIDKIGDKTIVELPRGGGSFTVNYEGTVTKSCRDVDFRVAGSITIENISTGTVTVSSVADVLNDGTVAVVTCPVSMPATIAYQGSLVCTYVASPTGKTSTLNTATVRLSTGTEARATAAVVWGAPSRVVDGCVTVTDSQVTLTNNTVCSTTTFRYSKTYTVKCGSGSITNTATFRTNTTGTTGQDSWVVNYDSECFEWCSPGFWLNNAVKWGASAWKVPTTTLYSSVISSPTPIEGTNPTLLQVLEDKSAYFTSTNQGEAFNKVGDYLSIQAGLNFNGTRTGTVCPINQQGVITRP